MDFDLVYAKDLDSVVEEKQADVIDLRSVEEYEREHWKDAGNFPYEELIQLDEEEVKSLFPTERYLIFYCYKGGNSMKVARLFGRMGYHTGTVVGGYEVIKKWEKKLLEKYFKKAENV